MSTDKIINTVLKYLAYICLFAVLIVPTIVNTDMFFLFITGKAYTFRILTEIAFAIWLILVLRDRSYLPNRSWILGVAAVFTVIVGVADLAGIEPLRSLSSNYERMEGFNFIFHLFIYLVTICGMFGNKKIWAWFANASLLVSLIIGIKGLSQLADNPSMRIDSYLGNSSYLGIYALFHFFIALYFWLNALYHVHTTDEGIENKNWNLRSIVHLVGYGVTGIFNFYIMFKTGTRGSMMGLFIGMIFISLMLALFEKSHKGIKRTGIIILCLVFLSTVSLGIFKNSDFVKSHNLLARFSELATFDVKSVFENQGHGRSLIWGIALKGFYERPILGWGQDNFMYVFSKYYNPEAYGQESWFDRTHNVFLDWLIASGLLGLGAYLFLYGTVVYAIWKRKDSEVFTLPEKSVLTGLLIAHFIHNLFVFDNLSSYIAFFSIIGYVHCMNARKSMVKSDDSKNPSQSLVKFDKVFTNDSEIQNYIVAPIIVIALGFTIYFVNVPGISANKTLIKALISCQKQDYAVALTQFQEVITSGQHVGFEESSEQALSCASGVANNRNIDANLRGKWVSSMEETIAMQLKKTPDSTRAQLFAGAYMNNTQRYSDAIKYLTRALELSPGKQAIMSELGSSYLNLNETDKALALFEEIYKTSPAYVQGQVLYAAALVYADQEKKANEIFGATSSAMTSDNVIGIYESKKQYEKVIQIYRIKASVDPSDIKLAILPGVMYFKYGMKERSISEFEALMPKFPLYKDQIELVLKDIKAGKNPFVK